MTAIMKLQKDFVHVQKKKTSDLCSQLLQTFYFQQCEHEGLLSFMKHNPLNRWNCTSTFIVRLTVLWIEGLMDSSEAKKSELKWKYFLLYENKDSSRSQISH